MARREPRRPARRPGAPRWRYHGRSRRCRSRPSPARRQQDAAARLRLAVAAAVDAAAAAATSSVAAPPVARLCVLLAGLSRTSEAGATISASMRPPGARSRPRYGCCRRPAGGSCGPDRPTPARPRRYRCPRHPRCAASAASGPRGARASRAGSPGIPAPAAAPAPAAGPWPRCPARIGTPASPRPASRPRRHPQAVTAVDVVFREARAQQRRIEQQGLGLLRADLRMGLPVGQRIGRADHHLPIRLQRQRAAAGHAMAAQLPASASARGALHFRRARPAA